MNKHLLLLASTFFIFSCKYVQVNKDTNAVDSIAHYKPYRGHIFANAFINKVGHRNPDIQDYYFRHYGKNYFIKLQNCKFEGNIASFNNAYVYARGEIRSGLWDTDNPNEQSRVGEYFVFSELNRVERPLSISFQDGNNNRYIAKSSNLKYEPVPVIESSSGYYSGGKEKETALNLEDFMNIYFMLEELIENGQKPITERVKGSCQVKVLHIDKEKDVTYIFSDTPEVQAVKAFMDGLLER